jgi:hypothetical protein
MRSSAPLVALSIGKVATLTAFLIELLNIHLFSVVITDVAKGYISPSSCKSVHLFILSIYL